MAVTIVDDTSFKQQIAASPKVVVKYFAGWCGNCRLLAPKYKRLSEEVAFKDVLFLDIDAENNAEARQLAGVDNLPFIATFKNGVLQEGTATSRIEKVTEMIEAL